MKILVTGANGLLGRQLIQALLQYTDAFIVATGKGPDRNAGINTKRCAYHAMDITDGISANAFYNQQKPAIIIHTAAMTNVDKCETDKIGCWDVNVTATRFLLDAAKNFNPYIVYLSTDFVFDGSKGPYNEDDLTAPVNYYGCSKVTAENAMLESKLPVAIVRTCLVYSDVGHGTRATIISLVKGSLSANKKIQVVADQWRTPTYLEDLVNGIVLLVKSKLNGIFNIAGKELLTPYDMAIQVAAYYGLDVSLIEKVNSSNFTQPARRPLKTGLLIGKAVNQLAYCPLSFSEALNSFRLK